MERIHTPLTYIKGDFNDDGLQDVAVYDSLSESDGLHDVTLFLSTPEYSGDDPLGVFKAQERGETTFWNIEHRGIATDVPLNEETLSRIVSDDYFNNTLSEIDFD